MIKREMITMLHYDASHNPTQPGRKGAATSLAQAQAYLEQHPYDAFEETDLVAVSLEESFCRKMFLLFLYRIVNNRVNIQI